MKILIKIVSEIEMMYNTITIAWCITGGGAGIRSVAMLLKKLKEQYHVLITLFLTKWGFEVARIFGILDVLKIVAPGGYYQEFLVEDMGMYYVGRLNMKKYFVLVVAPATTNSIAKMVLGLADNIASALYSQAIKSSIPVIIMPTDIPDNEGFVETETPCYIDKTVCDLNICRECIISKICPVNAIVSIDSVLRIDLSKCIGCEKCVYLCRKGAVKCWEKIKLKPREIDVENIEKLKKYPGTCIVKNVVELEQTIKKFLKLDEQIK